MALGSAPKRDQIFFSGLIITVSYNSATCLFGDLAASCKEPDGTVSVVNIYGVARSVATLLQGMYGGIINCLFVNQPWIFIVIVLPAVLTCGSAYIMGVKGKRITKMVGPDGKKD